MSRIVYVNGEYLPEAQAKISVFDRGFLMADGVYEVTAVLDGKLVDFAGHMARLAVSLAALQLSAPASEKALLDVHRQLVQRNNLHEGLVYLQITRGVADRDFAWPEAAEPTLVLFTQARQIAGNPAARDGIRVATVEDIRWVRRDIKTVQLLAPSWAKMQARAKGADDAWLVEDGFVTEGTSNNAWIVTADGTIITRNLSHSILHGITRAALISFAAAHAIETRPFSPDEAKAAAEAFITSATAFVTPVVKIDDTVIADGRPGPITRRLRELYLAESRRAAV